MAAVYLRGMFLVGQFDSPFVRRVAISMDLLALPFEHRPWSVGADFEQIRQHNPLGRVPVLVLDTGESVVDSGTVLDYLDDLVGPARALVPASGEPRRQVNRLIALAIGAVEKGLQISGERVFRPAEKVHLPYLERCRLQIQSALSALELECAQHRGHDWMFGDRIGQADVTLGCVATYLREASGIPLDPWPALAARIARYDELPAFRRRYARFDAPVPR